MQPQESNISPTKHSNKLSIVFGITTLAFAGLAAFFGVNYFKQPAPKTDTPQDNTPTTQVSISDEYNEVKQPAPKTDTPQSNTPTTQVSISDEYNEVKNIMTDVLSSLIDGSATNIQSYIKGDSGLPVKLDGMNTYTATSFSLLARVGTNNIDNDLTAIKNKLTQNGFSTIGTLPFAGSAGPQIDGYKNSSNTVCGLSIDTEYSSINHTINYVILECAKPSWNWLKDEEKTLLKDLEAAYFEKTGKYPSILSGYRSDIKDSAYSPYQTIWAGIGGAAGLFYRTSPESKWQYFKATQSPLDCSDYDTDDLKKAYLGEECYVDNYNTSTVQL